MIHEQSNYVNFAHVEIEGLDELQVKSVSTYTTKNVYAFILISHPWIPFHFMIYNLMGTIANSIILLYHLEVI